MQNIKIINYAVISGETVKGEELPEEGQRRVAEAICDTIMHSAGYMRMPALQLSADRDTARSLR